ncbi:asparagine synthase (glutamine-hydrolyzing) [Tautonia plasticadhaerens]|uniref:asparagine synthase (glutamine-hydrolyzing) n=1 Tax=Tautonia plasticadhaerens TaxID=2527974 RepID=A0A518HFW4_9BACT|nr:asparagine synthase (glutamine-hydrolyzing) [Tautonia plasticadhaerens]QDV39715.1 Asparagine synthetase [glutamine-hydrolyzing] 1 [Tautonia plasticadhaerens]
MCGIAGLIYADRDRPVDPVALKAMGDAIAHRGPDAEGFLVEPGVGLVHRRLSIIDLSGGDQPIGNEDGSVQVVFNGEIYNYRDIHRELEGRGHRFRTRSDTEVLVHLYEELGDRLVDRLRGMFAFALWDRPRGKLLLARDRLGIKPLYVYRDGEKVLFGSELKAILAHGPGLDIAVDPEALEDYLAFGFVPGPRSILKGIEKLPPAHVLEARTVPWGQHRRRYWALDFEPDDRPTPEQWQEAIRAKVDEAVRAHLVADVPVGAFLSGGLDSSVVVALGADGSPEPPRTFSIGFLEEAFSELPYARQVADRFGTRHSEQVVTPDAAELLDELAFYFDEPFADASAVPTFLVSRLARRGVKVVLSGDGGDEAFGGYARYRHDLREAAVRGMLPGWFRRSTLGPLARAWPKADWLPRPLRAKMALTNLALEPDRAYANSLSLCRPPLRRRLMARDLAAALGGHDPASAIRAPFAAAPAGDPLAAMLSADVAVILPDDFLVKVDRASMAHGLEVRPPLLDHELMELAARIPSRWKVRSGEGKWIFKRAFEDRLPSVAVHRRKQGFEIPVDDWLRGPLRALFESSVLDPRARVADLIDQPVAGRLFSHHCSGAGRHGNVLWSLLVLARWAARHLDPVGRSAPGMFTR